MSQIHLRRWYPADADALSDILRDDPELRRQCGGLDPGGPLGAGAVAAFIDRHLVPAADGLCFAVIRDEQPVGQIMVSAIERRHDTGWASYWLTRDARGAGLAARGLATVSALAFAEGVFRLELGHRINNPASCRVALAAGFRAEGIERAKLRYGEQRFDVETHARLATDPVPDLEAIVV